MISPNTEIISVVVQWKHCFIIFQPNGSMVFLSIWCIFSATTTTKQQQCFNHKIIFAVRHFIVGYLLEIFTLKLNTNFMTIVRNMIFVLSCDLIESLLNSLSPSTRKWKNIIRLGNLEMFGNQQVQYCWKRISKHSNLNNCLVNFSRFRKSFSALLLKDTQNCICFAAGYNERMRSCNGNRNVSVIYHFVFNSTDYLNRCTKQWTNQDKWHIWCTFTISLLVHLPNLLSFQNQLSIFTASHLWECIY